MFRGALLGATFAAALGLLGSNVTTQSADIARSYFACEGEGELVFGPCANPSLSADGRRCAYATRAQLVKNDTLGLHDVYFHDAAVRQSIRVTTGMSATEPNGACGLHAVSLSADGSVVAYDAVASNLVPSDTNQVSDIFVTDTTTGKTTRVSVASTGGEANGASTLTALSADARWVVFASDATNLVSGDKNGRRDVFLHDRTTGRTLRVSGGTGISEANGPSGRSGVAVSTDGRFIAFDSEASNLVAGDRNGLRDIFVHDRVTGHTELISTALTGEADGASRFPAISDDGRLVAFASEASNLIKGDVNRLADVFVWDRASRLMARASQVLTGQGGDRASGEHAVAISGDGTRIAFDSRALNLVPGYIRPSDHSPRVHVHDRRDRSVSGRTYLGRDQYPRRHSGQSGLSLSRSGRTAACSSRPSAIYRDHEVWITVHDENPPPSTHPVGGSVDSFAAVENHAYPDVSSDGRFAVASTGSPLQVVLFDRWTGTQTTLSVNSLGQPGDGDSLAACFSPDDRYVAFESWAKDLAPNDKNGVADIFVKDLALGTLVRVNLDPNGLEAKGGPSGLASLSAGGRFICFDSAANNLVAGDTNLRGDVFVRDLVKGTNWKVSATPSGGQANGWSHVSRISSDGRYISFLSEANNLVAGDTNGRRDIFLHDRLTGGTRRVSVSSTGVQGDNNSNWPCITDDGRYVVFESDATNLVAGDTNKKSDIFLHDTKSATTTRISVRSTGEQLFAHSEYPRISRGGRWVSFSNSSRRTVPDDTNGALDHFVRDLVTGTTLRVTVDAAGTQAYTKPTTGASQLSPMTDHGTIAYCQGTLKVRDFVRRVYPVGPTRLGAGVTLRIESPADPGRAYQAAMALDYQPGIRLTARTIPLKPDALTVASLLVPALFPGFEGNLDAKGLATAGFRFPDLSELEGINFHVAFVVLDLTATDGIRGISNAARIQAAR